MDSLLRRKPISIFKIQLVLGGSAKSARIYVEPYLSNMIPACETETKYSAVSKKEAGKYSYILLHYMEEEYSVYNTVSPTVFIYNLCILV